MRELRRVKIRIDDPHFACNCLKYMSWTRFNYTFHLEEDKLQEFMALCLMRGVILDGLISEEKI